MQIIETNPTNGSAMTKRTCMTFCEMHLFASLLRIRWADTHDSLVCVENMKQLQLAMFSVNIIAGLVPKAKHSTYSNTSNVT